MIHFQAKKGVALLITLMFVLVITVAIGFGLKILNKTSQSITNTQFLYQSSAVIEDVLRILNQSPEIAQLREDNATTDTLFTFLSSSQYIPLKMQDMHLVVSITSARSKFNPNILATNMQAIENLKIYVNNYAVSSNYVDILQECMRQYKANNLYNNNASRLFDEYPKLFNNYIASKKQLKIINNFYKKEYGEENLDAIDFDTLFYYTQDVNMTIDLNYATPEVWQFLLKSDAVRAKELSANGGTYTSLNSLGLSEQEKNMLAHFKTSFYEPYLHVTIVIDKLKSHAKVAFEYDIKKKKGSNFVLQI